MSDYLPFDIQLLVMERLPVKSLIRFRSVSKQWKSFIDNSEFIKNYHINHKKPQHHLLVRYELDTVQTYTSIIDNNTFPLQKFPLTAPESLSLLRDTLLLSSADGLLCFCGYVDSKIMKAVIWNPAIRKSVGIDVIPKAGYKHTIVGFGVYRHPKLVRVSVSEIPCMWEVDVFELSTCVWKTVYMGAPFKSCFTMTQFQVFIDGVIYFRGYVEVSSEYKFMFNSIVSFDLKSEKFGEVFLPDRLVRTAYLHVAKVNQSLGLVEYYDEGYMTVCGVWLRKDGAKTFSEIYTVKIEGNDCGISVLGFRNNGEVVIQVDDDEESRIEVYDPLSGHTNGIGINGKQCTFSTRSYMETLLLLDQSDSITTMKGGSVVGRKGNGMLLKVVQWLVIGWLISEVFRLTISRMAD